MDYEIAYTIDRRFRIIRRGAWFIPHVREGAFWFKISQTRRHAAAFAHFNSL